MHTYIPVQYRWIVEERADEGQPKRITVEHVRDPLTLAILGANVLPLCSPKLRRIFHRSGMDKYGTPLWLLMGRTAQDFLKMRGFGVATLEELHSIMKSLVGQSPLKLYYFMTFDDDAMKLFGIRHEEK